MANLSITTAWNESAAFVRREAGLLFPIAFLLLALPGALLQLSMPTPPAPGQAPEAGLWMILLPVTLIVSMIGTIALSFLALRPGASVAEGLQAGTRRLLPVLGAVLLVAAAALLLAIPVLILIGVGVAGGSAAIGAAGAVLLLLLFAVYVFFWVRLMLMTAIGSVEPLGPVAIIRRSWQLTRGHFWRLLGFVLLALIAAIVVVGAISAVAGIVIFLLAGRPEPGSVSTYLMLVVSALLQAVVSMVFVTLIARIYAQLAGIPAGADPLNSR